MSFAFVEDVTSDLSFVARAATPEALFRAAADALLAATLEDPASLRQTIERPVALTEPDPELLLLHYLNEIIYLRDAERLLLRSGRLDLALGDDARLAGTLVGEPIDRARHRLLCEVKAATAYGLRVGSSGGGWEARVTLDV